MDVYQSSHTAEELEYALGAVPSIGANGNWFIGDQDTGVFAGGVDVTGASIGQIIKVSEVDENGRPTAWEAIDNTGGEWKRLAKIEVAEDNVNHFLITTDENGEPFRAVDFTIRIKTIQRTTSVSALKIWKPDLYPDGTFNWHGSKVIGQMNTLGNTGRDTYYTFQLTHEGDWRKAFVSESYADIFSKATATWPVANNIYDSGVTYGVGTVEFPINNLCLEAVNNFFVGDIVEVWYK